MIREAAVKGKSGQVHVGRRHQEIFSLMSDEDLKDCVEGFITDSGAFLNRQDAAEHAFICGQIPKPKKKLVSEDIY